MAIDPKKLSAFVQKESTSPFTPKKAKKKTGEPAEKSDSSEVDVDEIAAKIKDGKGDKNLMRLSKKVTKENNPPQWVEDEDIWEKAKEAVGSEEDFTGESYYAVVTHVYKRMGGSIKGE